MLIIALKMASGAMGKKQREIIGHLPPEIDTFDKAAAYLGKEVLSIDQSGTGEARLRDDEIMLAKIKQL
jgi:hypothetical protein